MPKAIYYILLFFVFCRHAGADLCRNSLTYVDELERARLIFASYVNYQNEMHNRYIENRYGSGRSEDIQRIERRSWLAGNQPSLLLHHGRTPYSVVMVHGLSDSPHYMRFYAEYFYNRGFNVVVLRLAGHGIESAALSDSSITNLENWRRDLDFGYRIAELMGDEVIGVGFSTGAALHVDAVQRGFTPKGLVLVAPAFKIKNQLVQELGTLGLRFIREFDSLLRPLFNDNLLYKYSPIALNGIYQVQRLIDNIHKFDRWDQILRPSVYTIVSATDATIDSGYALEFLRYHGWLQETSLSYVDQTHNISHMGLTGYAPNGVDPAPYLEEMGAVLQDRLDEYLMGLRE